MKALALFLALIPLSFTYNGAQYKQNDYIWIKLEVEMSAYNSVKSQTNSNHPSIAAWGDTLKPGMKAVAISRDLLKKGISHNTPIKIDGMDGVYLVKDKMHSRHRNKMDLYMGTDVQKAIEFGRQQKTIWYGVPKKK
ncbi:3D domain-containing protein [Zhouia amylolytica]|uniref:3D domain-containing protein n=1 Tax=Zhouia amylolytica TaxID=376730 RepID=UPI0020CE23F9|nr:3D domain-containing protein [Zhouia amylolytica]MCQ0111402.1 3D domain-containing protein [Zhouia amylolytica]